MGETRTTNKNHMQSEMFGQLNGNYHSFLDVVKLYVRQTGIITFGIDACFGMEFSTL